MVDRPSTIVYRLSSVVGIGKGLPLTCTRAKRGADAKPLPGVRSAKRYRPFLRFGKGAAGRRVRDAARATPTAFRSTTIIFARELVSPLPGSADALPAV